MTVNRVFDDVITPLITPIICSLKRFNIETYLVASLFIQIQRLDVTYFPHNATVEMSQSASPTRWVVHDKYLTFSGVCLQNWAIWDPFPLGADVLWKTP